MDHLDHFDEQPFSAAMARTAGITRDCLRGMVDHGRARMLLHGVYVASTVPDSVDLRARAAALVLPGHAVVSDRCAAWLLGIDVLDFEEHDLIPDLDVVSVGGRGPSRRRGVLGGKRDLLPEEILTLDGGVRVTTPLRTACDIGCLYGRFRALATIDEFRRTYRISERDLIDMLPRYRRRRGVLQLRDLIPLSTERADSQPESWVRLMIHDEGLPVPAAQVDLVVPGWGPTRVENAYRHLRIAVEYDGEEFHTSDADRERDDERRAALERAGWIILVVRKADLSARRRAVWLAELAHEIATRAPEQPGKRIYARGPETPSYRWKRR